jgi:hypothetical protein
LASHWVVILSGLVRMKPCKVCGKTVSPNAKTCPHCGEPGPAPKPLVTCGFPCDAEGFKKFPWSWAIVILVVITSVISLFFIPLSVISLFSELFFGIVVFVVGVVLQILMDTISHPLILACLVGVVAVIIYWRRNP